ncbi:unnamed protein product [Closterium sp. NIES-64]|nr:unnamed protein product [Closterium sp. NIES-64]
MASRVLVSGLPRSLPPLPPGRGPTCVPCVEGRQRAAPHSSEFPPTEAPLQTLHMDVWGPARVRGQGHERYFLLVVDDYSRYTTVFPLRSKGDVTEVLIDWICAARLQLKESFGSDFPVLHLHSDRGGEFSSARLGAFCQTSPTLRWTGKVGDASAFRVWGSRAFVHDLSADKLFPHAVPCVFLGFPRDARGWQFYHPASRRVLSSQDVTFDESVCYYGLFPYRTAPLPPPPLFLAPGPPPVDPLPPQGPAPSGVSQVDAVEPVEVAVDSSAARGAEPAGAGSGGAEAGGAQTGGAEPGGAEPGGAGSGGAEPGDAEPGGAEPGGARSARVATGGASSRREPLSPQELREWFARRWSRAAGAGGATVAAGPGGARTGGPGAAGTGGAAGATGVGSARAAGGAGAAGAGAAEGVGAGVCAGAGASGGAGVGAVGAGGATGAGAAAGGTGAILASSKGAVRRRPYFVPLLEQVLGLPPSSGPAPPLECPQPVQSVLSSYSSNPESDSLRAASPSVTRLLATVVTDPSFESTAASALVAELVDFAARCRLDYAASLVAGSESVCPPSVVGTYVDEVPPPGANIISGMWIFRVKRPPGSPPVFKARYVARGFSHRQGVDYFQTFSPTPKMTTLRGSLHEEIWLRRPPGFTGSFPPGTQWSLRRPVYDLRQAPREWQDTLRTTLAALGFAPSTADPSLFLRTDTSLPPFYILVYVDDLVFATADTAGLAHVKSELQKRHMCTDLGELRSYLGLQITRDRAQRTITLTKSHTVQQVLQCFDITYSSPQATPLSTRHSLSALPSDESVEPSGPYRELALQQSSQGYTFSLGSGFVSWRSTRSSSVLSSSCEAEVYAGAMAAQELRWLTYLLTDLGESPRSPPVLYVDNKAMLALCLEHRLEHRTKHIALRYFLARELQQRGQLRLAYVASEANTADIFTKALPPCDHQRFCTMLGLVPTWPHLLTS